MTNNISHASQFDSDFGVVLNYRVHDTKLPAINDAL